MLEAIFIHLNGDGGCDHVLRQSRERLAKYYKDKLRYILHVCAHTQKLAIEPAKLSEKQSVQFSILSVRNNDLSASVIDELPWLLARLEDKDNLEKVISRIDVFHMFVKR